MRRVLAALAALAVVASVALAQNAAVIAQRKEAMKTIGNAVKAPGAMAKGDAPNTPAAAPAAKTPGSVGAGGSAQKHATVHPNDSVGDICLLPDIARFAH